MGYVETIVFFIASFLIGEGGGGCELFIQQLKHLSTLNNLIHSTKLNNNNNKMHIYNYTKYVN